MHGSTVAQYTWIVLELTDGIRLDVYASANDFDRVLGEIRRCAPDAAYDSVWVKERMDIHMR